LRARCAGAQPALGFYAWNEPLDEAEVDDVFQRFGLPVYLD
jgi:hypothetical protein